MKIHIPPLPIVISAALIITGVTGAIVTTRRGAAGETPTHAPHRPAGPPDVLTAGSGDRPAGSAKTADSPGQPGLSSTPVPVAKDACTLLTPAVARRILGRDARQTAAGDTDALQTADTTMTSCAYTAANDSAQLMGRMPKNALGISENATVFGSARPPGAISESGYGQTAYWDPAKHRLNILSNNIWYSISCGSSSRITSEAIAAAIWTGA